MIVQILKEILAPKRCYGCKKLWHFLCNSCFEKIPGFREVCYVCQRPTENKNIHQTCKNINNKQLYYDKVFILKHYRNKYIKKMIHDAKFYHKKDIFFELASRLSDFFMYNYSIQESQNYIIICPPMSIFKKTSRWYNQSEILAKVLSKRTGISFESRLIKKQKTTRQQSHLSKKERIENVKNAFKIDDCKHDILDKKIVIFIDDVISTWATCNEISRVTQAGGAKEIIGLFIASD